MIFLKNLDKKRGKLRIFLSRVNRDHFLIFHTHNMSTSPTLSVISFCSSMEDAIFGNNETDNDSSERLRYQVMITLTELFYLTLMYMIASIIFLVSEISGICSCCDMQALLHPLRRRIKLDGNIDNFVYPHYRLKRIVTAHRYCNRKLHRRFGIMNGNAILTGLIYDHRDIIDDYDLLMTHLARQRYETAEYWKTRRMTDSKKFYRLKMERQTKTLQYHMNDDTFDYEALWKGDKHEREYRGINETEDDDDLSDKDDDDLSDNGL